MNIKIDMEFAVIVHVYDILKNPLLPSADYFFILIFCLPVMQLPVNGSSLIITFCTYIFGTKLHLTS